MGIKIGLLIAIGIIAGIPAVVASPGLTNSGGGNWQDQVDLTIKEKSGITLTDYQVSVQMSGGNFPANARPDGADIRFTDANGTELGYWIENWDYNGRNARIWVKVPWIPANGEAKIVMYYDNPSATGTSSGGATFEFFDDFDGTSLDGTRWYINNGAPSVSNGVLDLSGESVVSEKVSAFGYNHIFESFSKMSDTGNEPRSFLRTTNDPTTLDATDRFELGSWADRNEMSLVTVENGVLDMKPNQEKFPTSFEVLGMVRSNTKTEAFRGYISKWTSKKIPDKPLYLQLYSWGGETHYIDWARVRKYTLSNPALDFGDPKSINAPKSYQDQTNGSVLLTGEKTDVVMGEDILLKLSAVNLITKPQMHVQVIIKVPSGMSVTSSEFSKSGAGQFTADYELAPGDGRDVEVRIKSNQVGEFNVNGRIVYYFGDNKGTSEDYTLDLPIKVMKDNSSAQGLTGKPTPGFEAVLGISGLVVVLGLKWKK